MAKDHKVYGNTQRPDISLKSILVLPENLRRHELESSRESGGLLVEVMFVDHFSDPEIGDLDVPLMQQDVFGLDVPMNYFLIFHILQRHCDLGDVFFEDFIRQTLFMNHNFVLKCAAITKLEYEVE